MNLENFFDVDTLYNPEVDNETRNRIRVAVAAYAYEMLNQSIIDDSEFDKLARKIDLSINTRRPDLDIWFRKNFELHTGMWVSNHPDRRRLAEIANSILSGKW